jgi:sulfur carrier protein ThiS
MSDRTRLLSLKKELELVKEEVARERNGDFVDHYALRDMLLEKDRIRKQIERLKKSASLR